MKEAIVKLAGLVNMNHKELIVFFITSYGNKWKKELLTMVNIAKPGDKLAIDHVTNRIYSVVQTIEGDLNVREK